jgi:hypothetical protein
MKPSWIVILITTKLILGLVNHQNGSQSRKDGSLPVHGQFLPNPVTID